MIKAVAILTDSGKSTILETGDAGSCLDVARAKGLTLKLGEGACVQVFSSDGCIFNDDGRKADYQARQAAAEAAEAKADSPKEEKPAATAPKTKKGK